MKKTKSLTISGNIKNTATLFIFFVSLIFFLVSCGDDSNETNYDANGMTSSFLQGHEGNSVENSYAINFYGLNEMTTLFLEELDNLLNLLESRFGLFDVSYWARGIDIHALYLEAQQEILNLEFIDRYTFASILLKTFYPLHDIGNFSIFPLVDTNTRPTENEIEELAKYLNLELNNTYVRIFIEIIGGAEAMQSFLRDSIYHTQGRETANQFMETIQNRDFEGFVQIMEFTQEAVKTDILEDGKIAYLSILNLGGLVEDYVDKLFEFYEEIQDFDHFIIDLRSSRMVSMNKFYDLIVGPNILEPLISNGYMFFVQGSHTAREREVLRREIIEHYARHGITNIGSTMSIGEIFEGSYPLDLNMSDIGRLDYGFVFQIHANPNPLSRFKYQPAFDGKIWILINDNVRSHSEVAVRFLKETGFATLVGDITGGNFGGPPFGWLLPNSDIHVGFDRMYVIDSQGRPFEAGTIPHHFNRPGMDALETVLALISEGQY